MVAPLGHSIFGALTVQQAPVSLVPVARRLSDASVYCPSMSHLSPNSRRITGHAQDHRRIHRSTTNCDLAGLVSTATATPRTRQCSRAVNGSSSRLERADQRTSQPKLTAVQPPCVAITQHPTKVTIARAHKPGAQCALGICSRHFTHVRKVRAISDPTVSLHHRQCTSISMACVGTRTSLRRAAV